MCDSIQTLKYSLNRKYKNCTFVSSVLMVPATESSLIGSGDACRKHLELKEKMLCAVPFILIKLKSCNHVRIEIKDKAVTERVQQRMRQYSVWQDRTGKDRTGQGGV